jgi:hypothetical protein
MAFLPFDRWERLQNRRGVVQKKSARHTKPGYRFRAATLEEVREARKANPTDIGHADQALKAIYPDTSPTWGSLNTNRDNFLGSTWANAGISTPDTTRSWQPVDTLDNVEVRGFVPVHYRVQTHGTTTSTTNSTIWLGGNGNQPIDIDGSINWPIQLTKKDRLKSKIRAQMGDSRQKRYRYGSDFSKVSGAEIVALQMLKGMLNEDEWKRYLRYGFVVVEGKSGLVYQVIRTEDHIKVFRRGSKVAELCIYINGVPPTDQVIAKKIMLECNEMGVWHDANIRQHRWDYGYKPTNEELARLAA